MKKIRNTWIPDADTFFPAYFEHGDVFEQKNLDTALSFVKDWTVAVDVGAHVGSWARYMAGRFGTVYAFEPHPENFLCLLSNAQPHGVVCIPAAVGNQRAGVSLESGNNTGCWHVREGGRLPMVRLPDFGSLGFLKIDVEGFEAEVIEGAREQIEKYRPVVLIEEKDLPHKKCDFDARRLLELMDYREVARSGRDVIFA